MTSFQDLEALIFRSALLFCATHSLLKFALKRFNGFDALALAVLACAVVRPFLAQYGYIVQIALSGLVVAALAMRAGASRNGMLLLSNVVVFTDALAESERIVGDMDDVERCTPVVVAAVLQAALLALLTYAVYHTEAEQQEAQLKMWVVVAVGASAARSATMSYDCHAVKRTLSELASMIRTLVLVGACVANGADETDDGDER